MVTGKEDLLNALIEAFLMEKGTREFYSQASDMSVSGDAKKTFRELSDWEQKHMDFIQSLYQSVNGDIELRSFEEFNKRTEAPMTEAGIPVKDLEAKIEKYQIKDEKAALTLAMEIEGKAYNLYRKLSQGAKDTNAKVVFEEMMAQEMKHVDYLKDLRLKLVKVY
ncbi:MAG: ferritin family protein [Nitrospirae bacterium]|nr:ferritin family protein [Nitrospirota bacterium]MBI4847255.1 ferritin family protein [Nitrospirota bacterium]